MALHLTGRLHSLDSLPRGFIHTFLIRNPERSILSFYKISQAIADSFPASRMYKRSHTYCLYVYPNNSPANELESFTRSRIQINISSKDRSFKHQHAYISKQKVFKSSFDFPVKTETVKKINDKTVKMVFFNRCQYHKKVWPILLTYCLDSEKSPSTLVKSALSKDNVSKWTFSTLTFMHYSVKLPLESKRVKLKIRSRKWVLNILWQNNNKVELLDRTENWIEGEAHAV